MEKILKETMIQIEETSEQLQFVEIKKFNKAGCHTIFSSLTTGTIYDVLVLSITTISMNNIKKQLTAVLKRYQQINSKLISSISSVGEDQSFFYIVSKAENHTFGELVEKRDGLTQFQIVYFILDFIEGVNYMKSRNLCYQTLSIDEIRLNKNNKLMLPFSIFLSQTNSSKNLLRLEGKKLDICPELIREDQFNIDQVNAWNLGVFAYQLYCGKKPFDDNQPSLQFPKPISRDLKKLLSKLLIVDPQSRLKMNLLLIEEIFKKYSNLPHILPNTIFLCPPTAQFITQYDRQFFQDSAPTKSLSTKILNIKTAKEIEREKMGQTSGKKLAIKSFKSFKHIQNSETSFQQEKIYINDFIDLSHKFGYGYQMTSGLIAFKFNDGTSMHFENGEKKNICYSEKKNTIVFSYEKIPQEIEIKKKFYILEAFSKSLKADKYYMPLTNQSISSQFNLQKKADITIQEYKKTNYASIFLFSNLNTLQFIFIDKIMIILTKYSVLISLKNSDKLQPIENIVGTAEILAAKKYALTMAQKIFHWNIEHLEPLLPQNEKQKQKSSLKKLCSMNEYCLYSEQNMEECNSLLNI